MLVRTVEFMCRLFLGEGACSFSLVIPAFYAGNEVLWIHAWKVDPYSGSNDTYSM